MIDDEIVIPIISTGDIKKYVLNQAKIRVGEYLILSQLNTSGLKELMPMWLQSDRLLYISAKSEASWSGLNKDWDKRLHLKNKKEQDRYNLPR